MAAIFLGLTFFALALTAHLCLRHFWKSEREILKLILILLITPTAVMLGLYFTGRWDLEELLTIGSLHIGLSLAYMQTYPALLTQIPTFRIVFLLHRTGPRGMNESEILEVLSDRSALFSDKIIELEKDGFAFRQDGRLRLNRLGRWTADFFILYRKILGLKRGRG